MTVLEIVFLIFWGLIGLCGWFNGYEPWFRWWLSAGFIDKIMMGFVMVLTLIVSLFFGPISFVLWRTNIRHP